MSKKAPARTGFPGKETRRDKPANLPIFAENPTLVQQRSSPARICLAYAMEKTTGPIGESASAFYGLAQHLARLGHTVTLLCVPASEGTQLSDSHLSQLRKWMFDNFLVRLEQLTESTEVARGGRDYAKSSALFYHYLRKHPFDIVYVAAEGGLAHFPLLAKRTGVFEPAPPIVVVAHEPTLWRLRASKRFVESKSEILTDFMERESVARCDHLVATCGTLLQWMRDAGWTFPKTTEIVAPIPPEEWRIDQERQTQDLQVPDLPFNEVVHVSHAVTGSDISLFCDAIDRLAQGKTDDLTITFLGPFETISGEHSGGLALRRSRDWPFRVKFHPVGRPDDMLDYLARRRCLAVLTPTEAQLPVFALACVDRGISFLLTQNSGLRELLGKSDAEDTLVQADSNHLAVRISTKLGAKRHSASTNTTDRNRHLGTWNATLRRFLKSPQKKEFKTKRPLVTIITAHYNRPTLLQQAMQSVISQDYPRIEYIVVDDGSTDPKAKLLLDQLESEFRRRKWRIIRKKNGYLGAARNAGIRAAQGSFILFLDDDNILFPSAVSTLVSAADRTQADICTTFSRLLYEKFAPRQNQDGYIDYFPTGGPTQLALLYNPYGDANAMFRRSVFDRIGLLNEERGLSTSDWEFFTRADLAGLKLIVVPEALYWYRSDQASMSRSAHWYKNHLPIIALFKNNHAVSMDLVRELSISQNKPLGEIENAYWNLVFRQSDKRFMEVAKLEPNSPAAMELLSKIAAETGRADTAISLLSHVQQKDFFKQVDQALRSKEQSARSGGNLANVFQQSSHLDLASLENFTALNNRGRGEPPSFYVDNPNKLYIEAVGQEASVAALAGGCPAGTLTVKSQIRLGDVAAQPLEFMMLITPALVDAHDAVINASTESTPGCSGWCRVSHFEEPRQIEVGLPAPSSDAMNLVIAVRNADSQKKQRNLGTFSDFQIKQGVGPDQIMRPRKGEPSHKRRARILDEGELRRARLLTNYSSTLPLLLIAPDGGGIFLRPHNKGPVAALLSDVFSPLARSVIADIEIAHESASPFEFAMLLTKPHIEPKWNDVSPTNAVAFSGWHRVDGAFRLQQLTLTITERVKERLSLTLAVRLPRGAAASPANAFWRRLMVTWDE